MRLTVQIKSCEWMIIKSASLFHHYTWSAMQAQSCIIEETIVNSNQNFYCTYVPVWCLSDKPCNTKSAVKET